jgi:hypothetical protein
MTRTGEQEARLPRFEVSGLRCVLEAYAIIDISNWPVSRPFSSRMTSGGIRLGDQPEMSM